MEHDSVEEALEQMQDMECDDNLSEIIGDAEDLEMSEKRDNLGEMPVRLPYSTCFYILCLV